MKAILVVDIPDEMCDDYDEWYLVSYDEIQLRYEEDGALMHYKDLGMNLELKPMPEKKEVKTDFIGVGDYDFDDIYNAGFNGCIDEIEGETK